MIHLNVNHEARTLVDNTTIAVLLETMDIGKREVAVAVNGEVVARAEHATTVLREGDDIEIVRMISGGSVDAGNWRFEAGS
jgi:sulfur carrier protein